LTIEACSEIKNAPKNIGNSIFAFVPSQESFYMGVDTIQNKVIYCTLAINSYNMSKCTYSADRIPVFKGVDNLILDSF